MIRPHRPAAQSVVSCQVVLREGKFHRGPAVLAGTQPGDDLGGDDDDEEDEEASVTTDSTTLASDAAALASSLAQRSLPTEPAPRALGPYGLHLHLPWA